MCIGKKEKEEQFRDWGIRRKREEKRGQFAFKVIADIVRQDEEKNGARPAGGCVAGDWSHVNLKTSPIVDNSSTRGDMGERGKAENRERGRANLDRAINEGLTGMIRARLRMLVRLLLPPFLFG